MKLQGLAVIAIIIILPMSIILTSYSKNQMKTLDLQVQYDSKLKNATYDAIKAFQLNMSNSSTSDLANSKMRDIKASINTFYNSLSNHFNMYGYGKEVLQNYVPAVVYTLYDGYYIYSAYDNKLDPEDTFDDKATYQNGETIYGLKPYIYYSCRYKPNTSSDFTITYSLDSYITIQGEINGEPINESGYLLSSVTRRGDHGGNFIYNYNGVDILEENNLAQNVYIEGDTTGNVISIEDNGVSYKVGSINEYPYRKINGVKYYKDNSNNVFAIINNVKYNQNEIEPESITNNKNAIKYYEDAYNFKEFIKDNDVLRNLRVSDAVDSNGKKYTEYGEDNPYYNYGKIFEELFNTGRDDTFIEDSNSNFNAHKLQVIKNSIESNLIVAISNYNRVSTSDVNFQMPKLEEYEWEQITQKVSMITFLQGLNIGGKIYNGQAIISNNLNEDYVSEDAIYIALGNEYYKVNDNILLENTVNIDNATGIFNVDFERRTGQAIYVRPETKPDGSIGTYKVEDKIYYYPRNELASYSSIVDANNTNNEKSISEYVEDLAKSPDIKKQKLAQKYYTALARERYGMYRVTNKLEKVQEDFID